MSKHTPGPWRFSSHPHDGNYMRIHCSSDPSEGYHLRGYCGEANARLIAAAPTMYEALKQIEPILARMYGSQAAELPPMQIVRAAIAKAEAA